jgi:hypothetical protein
LYLYERNLPGKRRATNLSVDSFKRTSLLQSEQWNDRTDQQPIIIQTNKNKRANDLIISILLITKIK